MTHATVLALSINGGLKTLGAYAGLAAVVALALLALLFFSQARELRRLREFIEREAQRPRPGPPPPRGPVPGPPPVGAPAPITAVAGAVQASPLVASSVEGVRRVPIVPAPSAAGTAVLPGPPAGPDATTISEPPGAEAPPLPPPPPSAPRLIAERVLGQEPGSAHEIGDGVLLGRGKSATIRLTDRLASGSHARIAPTGERIMIEDLGSTNGTFVNGVQLSAPAALNNADRIRLGESEFLFEQAPPMPPPPGFADVPPPGADAPPPGPPPPGLPDGETVAHDDIPAAGEPAAGAQENTGTEDEAAAAASFPAVPLLATPVPQRTLEFTDETFAGDAPLLGPSPPRASPLPHPDSPLVGPQATERPVAPIRRRLRTTPAGYETPIAPRRAARRLRGFGGGRSAAPPARGRLAMAGGVLTIAAIALVVVLLHGGGGGGGAPSGGHRTPPAKQVSSTTPSPAAPARSGVTVTVLNGTAQAGLASQLSAKLVADGFAKGAVGDTTSPTVTATTVSYTTGNRAGAEEVAGVLHLSRASVVPLGSSAAASAGTRPAKVVVTIGANYPH